jgi:hypothetical protein
MYSKEKMLGEKYKETFELWRERNTMTRNHMDTKLLLIKLYWIINAERTTIDRIDEIKGKVTLRVYRRYHKSLD